MNKSNRYVTQNNQNYRRNFQERDQSLREGNFSAGRDRSDGNTNPFNENPDRNTSSRQRFTAGRTGRDGGNENYADRGYSQQAGGWGEGREINRGSSNRFEAGNEERYYDANSYRMNNGSGSYNYPSTDRLTRGSRDRWQGNPSESSDYGSQHFNWDSETSDVEGTRFDRNENQDSGRYQFNRGYSNSNTQNKESHYGRGPKGYKRSDERIHEDASDALTRDHDVDASEIEVSVAEGVVTLSGTVTDRMMKRHAEECVEHLEGVKDVKNNLTVSGKSAYGSSSTGASENKDSKTRTQSKLQ